MIAPAVHDTIVAVASGWGPATVGIVRLSGPDAFELAGAVGADISEGRRFPAITSCQLSCEPGLVAPAAVYWFRGPASYSGQNLVELHVPGCLPLLALICDRLVAAGARRALPGEFTARAYLAGKLDAGQVRGVFNLLHAEEGATARLAARAARGDHRLLRVEWAERVRRLLALIEAGIDFVEEEDVRFISAAAVAAELSSLIESAKQAAGGDAVAGLRSARPRVALAGLPNAGKSTLFNALLGNERAIVTPIEGTTRDVLSAELKLDLGVVLLQDCAGIGAADEEIGAQAQAATLRAIDEADLVLWAHAADRAWDAAEREACERAPVARRILVRTKCDLRAAERDREPEFLATVETCAWTGMGLESLKAALNASVFNGSVAASAAPAIDAPALIQALGGALEAAGPNGEGLASPELVALELRIVSETLGTAGSGPIDEAVLDEIFSRFCVGK